jgi:hypothetical protein
MERRASRLYVAAVGLLAQTLAALVQLVGSEALQWLLALVGSLAVVVGLALYGAATLQAGVLARWCGWALSWCRRSRRC